MSEREKLLNSITLLLQSPDQSNVNVGFLQLLNFVKGNIAMGLQYYVKVMVVFSDSELIKPSHLHPVDQNEGYYKYRFNVPFLESRMIDVWKSKGAEINIEDMKAEIKTEAARWIPWRGEEILKAIK